MLPSKVLCFESELKDVTCIAFSSIGRMQMKWLHLKDKGVPVLERQIHPSVKSLTVIFHQGIHVFMYAC